MAKVSIKDNLIGLIFSKDRAMQLQATIESFLLHCQDSDTVRLNVLYKTSNLTHREQYDQLKARFTNINFIEETDFRFQVISLLEKSNYILFLVDDNIFVKPFSMRSIISSLKQEKDAIGFSLRLGRNTSYCYSMSSMQALPEFMELGGGILKYYWPGQQHDFGYPLEVSSSVYRVRDILELLVQLEFSNPNTLEGQMAANSQLYSQARSSLLCYECSVTFCNPVNIVQDVYENKHGMVNRYTSEELAECFSRGIAVDVEKYIGFTPNGAHQEVELYFKQISETVWRPMFSIIMANYNRAEYIGQAIESVLNQTFKDWELIIVEDCSTDNSLEIINRYLDDKRIRLIQHEHNRGYTAALKTGIANVRSEYFGILDSDDCLMPHAIATMYEFHVQRPQCGLIYSQFVACHEDLWSKRIGYCAEIPIGKTNLEMNVVSHFKTFKLRDYLKSPGYDEDILYAEDKDITYKMEEVTQPFFVDQCLYLFRELPDSQCHDETKTRIGVQSWEKAKNAAWERRKQLLSKLLGPNAHIPAEELLVTETNSKHPQHKPEFSIIMANYNHAKYVGEAIKSVLNQSFENWELIIVDDRSTDNSLEVIGPYLRDRRIRLVKHQQNKGYTAALKTAIAQVRSEYFGILDSDDCLSFDAVEVMYKEYVANPDCGFIYTQLQYCNEKLMPYRVGINKAVLPGRTSFDCDTISSQFKTFRMTDYLKTEGYNEDTLYAEDKDIIYKMEEVAKLRFVDKVLYLVRELSDSLCYSESTAQIGRLATAKAKINAIKRRCAALAKSKGENLEELFNKTIKEAVTKYHYDIGYYFIVLKNLVPLLRRVYQNETKLRCPNVPGDIMTCHIDNAVLWFAANLEFMKVLRIIKGCDIIFDAPRVSVYILTGRNSRFIRRAIQSVLAQDYLNFELLIVDDADDTSIKEIIDCYPDYRISYTKQSFNNIAAKMNQAIINAKGEYVIGVDSNDFIEPDYIGKMVECAEKYPDVDYFYPATSILIDEFDKPISRQNYPDFSENTVLPGFVSKREYAPIPSSGSLQRKTLFAKAGLYEKSDTADGSTFLCRNASKINFRRVDDSSTYFSREHADYYKNQLSLITAENKSPEPAGGSIRISVIVPCYNHARFLPEAIESIVNQTYKDWECIIVNDGSTDDTTKVAKKLIARYADKKIRLVQKENGGLADARNFGIQHAAADWILLLDSDDIYGARFLEKAFEIINADATVNVIFANPQMFGAKSKQWVPEEYSPQKILVKNTIVGTSLFKKELWKKTGGYDLSIPWGIEDWNFWISCSKLGLVVRRVEGKHFFYRIHKEGSMYSKMLDYWPEVKAMLRTLHPDLYEWRQLICDHEVISRMHSDTLKVICEKIERFPQLPMPYFWRGLRNERDGKLDEAISDYQTAGRKAAKDDWQAYARLSVLYEEAGDIHAARRNMEKILSIRPDFKWAKDILICLQQKDGNNRRNLKILFYFDRIGNLNETSPAGTVIAILNFARALQSSNPDVEIYITGDLVHYPQQHESFQIIPLPQADKRDDFLADYDVVFFATHVKYFRGLTKPSEQIWVLYQHCWEADDPVSLAHMNDFDAVICLSEPHKASLQGRSIGTEKLVAVPNLIDTNIYSPRDVSRNNHSVMFAGGLHPHKCIHILLDAFRLVRQQVGDAELHIYGDGAMWRGGDHYGNWLKSAKPEGVYFHGYVDNKDMPEIYSKHSILCLPSKLESFGLVTVEAQACGCIPVVHNVGGVAATLADGQTGLLYSPNTAEKLAEVIVKAMTVVDDDSSVRQRAVDFVRDNFSMARAAEYLSKLWDRLTIAREIRAVRALFESNNIKLASAGCERLLQKYPDQPDLLLLKALIMLHRGNKDGCKSTLLNLLERFGLHQMALNNLGVLSMNEDDPDKALEYFVKAYNANTSDKNTALNCCAAWKICSRYEEARMVLFMYLTKVGADVEVLRLLQEINNLIVGTGSAVNVTAQQQKDTTEHKAGDELTVIPHYEPGPSDPLVSVVMPVYNCDEYIGQSIESVLIQNYPKFELIIVDDGSTDNTKDIVASFKDDRIKYIYKENAGVASARNLAIRQAKGQYIIPLDADDMMTPDGITLHLKEFKECPQADLIYSDVLLIDGDGNPIRLMNKPEYQDRRHMIRDLFRAGHPIIPFRLGIRRSVFDKIGLYDEELMVAEDYDMIRRFVKAGLKAHHLSKPLHLRRVRHDSLSRTTTVDKARNHFDVVKRFTDTFAYDELFPGVAWDKIPPEMRQLHAKCLAAVTYQAIGQACIEANSTISAKMAFGQACSELNDCLKMDPGNQRIQQLLQKCEFGRQKYDEQILQVVR